MRILVVEDDPSVRETLGLVLETYGFTVDLVDGGEPALASLAALWPDLLLLDLTLREMSGEELYKRIEQRFGSAPPTVVLSAVQHGEERVRHLRGVRFLAKPYTLEQLIELIRETIATRAA